MQVYSANELYWYIVEGKSFLYATYTCTHHLSPIKDLFGTREQTDNVLYHAKCPLNQCLLSPVNPNMILSPFRDFLPSLRYLGACFPVWQS